MEQTQAGKVPSSVQEVPARGETFHAAREKLSRTFSGVSEQARQAAQYADHTVHHNPWTSIGVGFGLGVVVGALLALVSTSRRIL